MKEAAQERILAYFENAAKKRDLWKRRNRFYHKTIEKQFAFMIPEGSDSFGIRLFYRRFTTCR
jgi:hypothetical protein